MQFSLPTFKLLLYRHHGFYLLVDNCSIGLLLSKTVPVERVLWVIMVLKVLESWQSAVVNKQFKLLSLVLIPYMVM